MSIDIKQEKKSQKFVSHVLGRLHGNASGKKPDTGYGAALRRADNPDTEYQSWEHLAPWCRLGIDGERLPFATVSAALARAQPVSDGHWGIGRAIAECYADEGQHNGNEQDAAKAKLRRLLACVTSTEACRVLRSILRLIESRGVALNYGELLDDLLFFNERTRVRWAQDFYGNQGES